MSERVRLFIKIGSAVAYAHRNHIIHRDLKPANIMVDHDGEPHLVDFGIASILDPDSGQQQTVSRLGLMTPEYASPEQVGGLPLFRRHRYLFLGRGALRAFGRLPTAPITGTLTAR